MTIITLLLIPPIVWIFFKLSKIEGGFNFGLKNLGIALLLCVCISAVAYVIGGFSCDNQSYCEQRYIVNSLLIDTIVLVVWGVMLTFKKSKPNTDDILDS